MGQKVQRYRQMTANVKSRKPVSPLLATRAEKRRTLPLLNATDGCTTHPACLPLSPVHLGRELKVPLRAMRILEITQAGAALFNGLRQHRTHLFQQARHTGAADLPCGQAWVDAGNGGVDFSGIIKTL